MEIVADMTLDCVGLVCPEPVLRTKRALDGLAVGQVLKVIATDPGSQVDIAAWARRTGQRLLHWQQEGDRYLFYVRRER